MAAQTQRAPLVPDRMNLAAEWDNPDDVRLELWIDYRKGDGQILCITDSGTEQVGEVQDANGKFLVGWVGSFADRRAPLLNAERARAHRLYAEARS